MRSVVSCALFVLLAASCSDDPNAKGGAAGGVSGFLFIEVGIGAQTFKLDLANNTYKQLGTIQDATVAPDGKLVGTDGVNMFESDETLAQHRIIGDFDADLEKSNNGFNAPQVDRTGTKIAFTSNDGNLYVVDRASGNVLSRVEVDLITEGFQRPTWLPDGRIVAAKEFGGGLFVSDAAVTTMTRFDPNLASPAYPAVSPDGTKVAFILNKRLHTLNIDGTGLTPVITADEEDSWPVWSPDGTQIAYRVGGDVRIIPASGGTPIDLMTEKFAELDSKYFIFSGYQFAWR